MATALIFAGGTGKRMNSRSKPKQFLEMHGKPIIIYTLEHFEYHEEISRIVVVCLESWINELRGLLKRYNISKVETIVPGGGTGHDSILYGLRAMRENTADDEIVLIHDGVRPLITEKLITDNINTVRSFGNAITAESTRESVVQSIDSKTVNDVPVRDEMFVAKAPQSFYYKEILTYYERAAEDGWKSIDAAHLCSRYGVTLHLVPSTRNNIKITDPADYYMFRALYEALEGQQIYGL